MTDIKKKTKFGMIWNAIEKIGVQGVSFVLNLVLARLLSPSDYGTVGLLTIFLTFSNVFVESGFPRALIQKQDRTEVDFSTTFIFNIAVSVFLYIVLFFCAPAIADFYQTPELVLLERILFLVIILQALSLVQWTKLQIAVDFKKLCVLNFSSTLVSGVVAIICAYKGLGVWALVIQNLVRNILYLVLYSIACKWVPVSGFSLHSFKELFGFGSKLLLSGFIGASLTNIRNLIIGKVYSKADLGFFSRGQQFPELIAGTLASVLNNATFPLLASLQYDSEDLMDTFRKLIKITAMFSFPAMIGMAVLSDNIVLVLLGEKWLPCAFFLACISLEYVFRPLNILNMNILNAIGRSDLFLKVDMAKVPLDFILLFVAMPFGVKTYAIVSMCCTFIPFYINCFMIGRLYHFGAFQQLKCAWKSIVATISMGIIVYTLDYIWQGNEVFKLIVLVLTGICVYYFMLKVLREDEITDLERKLLHTFKNRIIGK